MKAKLFSAHEKKDLTRLLSKAVNFDDVFNLEELHRFLFGLAITPELIKPSEWLPVVLGEEMMEFDSEEEAGDMMAPLFLVCNRFYEEHHRGKLFFPFGIGDLETGDLTRISDWSKGLYQAMASVVLPVNVCKDTRFHPAHSHTTYCNFLSVCPGL